MKKTFFAIAGIAAALTASFSGCASAKGGEVVSREGVTFPVGRLLDSPSFIGRVYRTDMIANEDTFNFPETNCIVFEPGARSAWHTHGGMIVMAAEGIGYYQEEGKKAQILRPGDVVEIPEGVRHWHGAAPNSWFSQIVIYNLYWRDSRSAGKIVHVSNEEYVNLDAEEYPKRTKKYGGLKFSRAEKGARLPTFSGVAYVSDLTGAENTAGAPSLHYVAFEPGVVNNWHSHAGGQILIATDGIGYHQMEGGEVQVLRPGDVALCPPGVRHWHGGSKGGVFAHITANANPEAGGVQWYEPISDEEYDALPEVE